MLKVKIEGKKLNTVERREKAALIEKEMTEIVNHPMFKELFLKMSCYGELSDWVKSTPEERFAYFMDGSEVLDPHPDSEIDIYVDDYYTWRNVIGHTYPNDKYIYTNTKYFDYTSSKYSGSNFIHEYGHKKGFDHDFKSTARRPFSICYQLNEIYERVWDKIFGAPADTDWVKVCYRPWYRFGFKKCYWVKSDAV